MIGYSHCSCTVCCIGVHGNGMAEIPRNLRVSRGYGYECYGNTAGMDLTIHHFISGSELVCVFTFKN